MADPGVRLDRPPPLLVIKSVPKISKTKNPEGQGFAIALLAKASDYFVFPPEITMPKASLSGMTVEALMDLRKRVDEMLLEHRAESEASLVFEEASREGRPLSSWHAICC